MSQYCGVPCVCSVHGAGDESDSSAFICVQADSVGYSISDATCFVRALRHAAVERLVGMTQKATAGQHHRAGQNERQDFAKAIHAVCLRATSARLLGRRTVRLQFPRGIALSFDRQAKSARLVFSLRLLHTLQITHFYNCVISRRKLPQKRPREVPRAIAAAVTFWDDAQATRFQDDSGTLAILK